VSQVLMAAHTDAVIRGLRLAFDGSPILVGDGAKPDGAGWQGVVGESAFVPYVMVFPILPLLDGDISDPHSMGTITYQITSVGPDRRSCEQTADRAATVMLDAAVWIDVPGYAVVIGSRNGGGNAQRDDSEQPPVWFAPDRFDILSTPALSA
jgi:hypothetical protein